MKETKVKKCIVNQFNAIRRKEKDMKKIKNLLMMTVVVSTMMIAMVFSVHADETTDLSEMKVYGVNAFFILDFPTFTDVSVAVFFVTLFASVSGSLYVASSAVVNFFVFKVYFCTTPALELRVK